MALISWSALRRRRRVLLVVLLPIAAILVCELIGWPFLRSPAERLLSRELQRPMEISRPFTVRFLGSIRLKTAGLWIAAPEEFGIPHFLDAQDIALKLRYGDLWTFRRSNTLRIASLNVARMDAQLLRNESGNATWQFHKPSPSQPPPELPKVGLLTVRQGKLVFRNQTLETDLTATFDTQEGTADNIPASHLQVQGRFRKRAFRANLTTNGWLPAANQSKDAPPVAAKGWLSYGGVRAVFDGTVTDLFGRRGIKGQIAVQGPSLALLGQLFDSPLPTTSAFSLQGTIDKEEEVWRIDVTKAKIGESLLAARVTYDPIPKPPRLEGQLKGKNLVLADLGPAFGTRDEEGVPIAPRPGYTLPNRPLDLPSLKHLDAKVIVDLDRVDLGSAFKEPIQPFRAVLTLDGGQMGLAKIDAHTAKGRLSGDIAVDARKDFPHWRSDLVWEGIRLEDWLKNPEPGDKGRKRAVEDTSAGPYFTGILQGRSKLAGSGRSTAEVLGSLNGEITAFVRNGTLSRLIIEILGLDVAQGLGLVIRGDETLPVQCAVMDLEAKHGEIAPRVALVDTPVTLVLIDGTANLAKESLDLRLTAKPKNVSPLTLRSPILVQGTFSDPRTMPKPGPIAARLVGGVALAFVNPLAAILPFIDPGSSETSPCAQALANLKR